MGTDVPRSPLLIDVLFVRDARSLDTFLVEDDIVPILFGVKGGHAGLLVCGGGGRIDKETDVGGGEEQEEIFWSGQVTCEDLQKTCSRCCRPGP